MNIPFFLEQMTASMLYCNLGASDRVYMLGLSYLLEQSDGGRHEETNGTIRQEREADGGECATA